MNTSHYYLLKKNKIKYKPEEFKKPEEFIKPINYNSIENGGIIPLVTGGLGNQIFIIVAAYIVSRNLNCKLYVLNNPESKHNFLRNNYNKSIFKFFGIHIDKNQDNIFINHLIKNGYNFNNEYFEQKRKIPSKFFFNYRNTPINNNNIIFVKKNAYSEWDYKNVSNKTILNNYYQYYPCIKPFETEIQNLLLNGLEEYINNIKNSINISDSAFIHVRRGDFLSLSDYHFIQPISYYESAYNSLIQKNNNINKIYILSNDFVWVKDQDFFKNIPNKEYFEVKNELEVLALMTLCDSGAICANSTFSWWGAFLGTHKKNNPVFVPTKWCADKPVNLFPSTWNII